MKGRSRLFIVASFALFYIGSLSGLDFGLVLNNDSSVSGAESVSFSQENSARAWFSLPLAASTDLFVSALYTFKGTFEESDSTIVPWRIDIGRTELSGQSPLGFSHLRYSLGRININDFSARLITGLTDGGRLELSSGNTSVYLVGAYRGLLFKEDARSFIDAEDYTAFDDDDVYFALPRAVAGIGIKFIENIPWHDVGIETWAQFDLDSEGTRTNTQYIEPYIEGRIGRAWRWRAWGIGETGYADEFFWALSGGGLIKYSKPELKGLTLSQALVWASGMDGDMSAFTPIHSTSLGEIVSRPFSDVLSYALDVSVSPQRYLNLKIGANVLFRTSDDLSTFNNVRTEADGYYIGTEANTSLAFLPKSDISFGLSGGFFLPNSTTLYVSGTKVQWTAGLTAELKL